MDISFIVIGYNEGWILDKVIDSLSTSIRINKLDSFEIIYVDSKSEDNSLEIASRFDKVKKFLIEGESNAAIARNIGAREASGNILFFMDGDMEINPLFLRTILIDNHKLENHILTGHLDDHFYNYDREFITTKPRTYKFSIPTEEEVIIANGGAFVVSKKNWEKVNGMNTKYRTNEDYDISLRFTSINLIISRLPILLANHHTIDYNDQKRMWLLLFQGQNLFSAVLFRNHFLNFRIIQHTFRRSYTAFILILSFIAMLINPPISIYIIIGYSIILTSRVIVNTLNTISKSNSIVNYFLQRLTHQILSDLSFIFSFLFFYPKEFGLRYKKIY